MKRFAVVGLLVSLLPSAAFVVAEADRRRDAAAITEAFRSEVGTPVPRLGTVRRLEILPLINWHTDDPNLSTEAGVSYLVRADDLTILFDLGLNAAGSEPSALVANMNALAVELGDVDAVFLSHAHLDHVGGKRWADAGSFALTADQDGLSGKPVFSPVPLAHPNAAVSVIATPRAILPGIASTGPIARRLFVGRVDEQALVVNVEGLGLVAIVGCGHQTVPRLLTRIDATFREPLFGIVGDLHYPVPDGRLRILGIDVQRRLASGDGPLAPIGAEQVRAELEVLSDRLGVLALGGHDTSNDVLDKAEGLLAERFRRVIVGEPIVIEAASMPPLASVRSSP